MGPELNSRTKDIYRRNGKNTVIELRLYRVIPLALYGCSQHTAADEMCVNL